MSLYTVEFTHDRDGAVAKSTCEVDTPRMPSFKFWEEEDIGDEVYWKIETTTGLSFVRKSFLCSLSITLLKSDKEEEDK